MLGTALTLLGLVGVDGRPLRAEQPAVVGLNVYEAPGGEDSIAAIAVIRDLRRRRERVATLVIAPGEVTLNLLVEVAFFNAEVYQNRELTDEDCARLRAAVTKRFKRAQRRSTPVVARSLGHA